MADLKISGRMKVKTLRADFKKAFGATLRVYTTPGCKQRADDDATLATLMDKTKAKGGECTFGSNLLVGNFERKVTELYGIGVQVATPDDSGLCPNDITLCAAGKK
jgi:hypothetical protein